MHRHKSIATKIFFCIFISILCLYFYKYSPAYRQESGKRHLLLTVGVLSKLSAISRRVAIRETWWNVCRENTDKVECTFFTDTISEDLNQKNRSVYVEEREKNDDLVYMPFKGSTNLCCFKNILSQLVSLIQKGR